jgi:hypothetical protein
LTPQEADRVIRIFKAMAKAEGMTYDDFAAQRVAGTMRGKVEQHSGVLKQRRQRRAGDRKGDALGQPGESRAENPQVRTPDFKRWFGDWEAAEHKRCLEGAPVVALTGGEFKKSIVPLTKRVAAWFKKEHGGVAVHPTLGTVTLNERGVKDSLYHGLGRDKAVAFAAVPDIIANGRIIAEDSDWKGRKYQGFALGAPVRIAGQDYVGVVIIRRSANSQRFYLHEVSLREKLQQDAFKTGADAAEAGGLSGAPAGAIKTLLRGIFSVKPTSAVVNADGSPKVVYRGTRGDFTTFDTRGGSAELAGTIWFAEHPDDANFHALGRGRVGANIGGANVKPVYLNLRNPLVVRKNVDRLGDMKWEAERIDYAYRSGKDGIVFQGAGEDGTDVYVAFDPAQTKSATGNRGTFDPNGPDILKQRQADPDANIRGEIQFLDDGRAIIRVFEAQDLSTFAHEIGHVLDRWLTGHARETADDFILNTNDHWTHRGVKPARNADGTLNVAGKEKLARAWERYLRDGKAPTEGLQKVFDDFKKWLTAIYKSLKGSPLDLELTPEIRALFDSRLTPGGVAAFEAAMEAKQQGAKKTIGKKKAKAESETVDVAVAIRSLRDVRGSDQAAEAAKEFIGKPLRNDDAGITATVSGESLSKMLHKSSWSNSFSSPAHMKAVGNLDKLFPMAVHL